MERENKNKKGEMNFTKYFLFFFIAISLLGVFGALTGGLMMNYDVNTSAEFDAYVNSYSADYYASEQVLGVDASGGGSGEFSEYESSFKFGEQVKTTSNQTKQFVKASSDVLGLDSQVWIIISTILFIIVLVLIVFFLRGINEARR